MGSRVNVMSEEEYIEECRKAYRRKMNDARFVVGKYIQAIAERVHPEDPRAAYQMRFVLSRMIRSKFNVQNLANLKAEHKAPAVDFLGKVEELMRGE